MVGLRPEWAVKAIVVLVITSILFRCVSAGSNHTVGGVSGWDLTSNLLGWAAETTFRVGDNLVFSYTPVHDVLEVHHLDYHFCHTVHPIHAFNDGETVIPLTQPGSRYFICGRPGHCSMGLRLQVQVLPQLVDDHNNNGAATPSIAPSSSPTNSPRDSAGSGTNRHGNNPSLPPHRAPPIGGRRRPPPPPSPASVHSPPAPAPDSNFSTGIEPSPAGNNATTTRQPPCHCGSAGDVLMSFVFWWVPMITALVMLVSSWCQLGFLFGVSHLVIV